MTPTAPLTPEDRAIFRRIVSGSDPGFRMSLSHRRDADHDYEVCTTIAYSGHRLHRGLAPRIRVREHRWRAGFGLTMGEHREAFGTGKYDDAPY